MAENYGVWTGVGQGLGELGEAISRRRERQSADRDKQAESYEKQAQAIANNIAQLGGRDAPEAQPMVQELYGIVTKHNALYKPHETPALIARIGKVFGKQPGPPTPDPRASMTVGRELAQAPIQPNKFIIDMNNYIAYRGRMGVPRDQAMKEYVDQQARGQVTGELRERLDAEAIANDKTGQYTPAQVAQAQAVIKELDAKAATAGQAWKETGPPIQVTPANQATIEKPVGTWVQPQINPQGQYQYREIPAPGGGGQLTPRLGPHSEPVSINDAFGNTWFPDAQGNWGRVDASGNRIAAPPDVQGYGRSLKEAQDREQKISDDAAEAKEEAALRRQKRTDEMSRRRIETEGEVRQFQTDLKPEQARLDKLTSLANTAKSTDWKAFLAAVQDSEFGKGKQSSINTILGTKPWYLGGGQITEIQTQEQLERIMSLLNAEIKEQQAIVDAGNAQLTEARRKLIGGSTPTARPNPPPPSRPGQDRGAAGGVRPDGSTGTATPSVDDVVNGLRGLAAGQRGQPR